MHRRLVVSAVFLLSGLACVPTDSPEGDDGVVHACSATNFLRRLDADRLLVGAMMEDSAASSAPFDLRYIYLAGGTFDSETPCNSCSTSCTSGGQTCAQGGCGWWGCWQEARHAPGQYLRDFLSRTEQSGQLPYITYYQQLQSSGSHEGAGQIEAAQSEEALRRFFNDYRFFLQQVGERRVLIHLEPDLWGYAQQRSRRPQEVPAAVSRANPTDCRSQPDDFSGFSRCLIAMTRRYTPNALVGLHGSSWATNTDTTQNRDPRVDVRAHARLLGTYLLELGAADTDFLAVDASDRDAGFDASYGSHTMWDDTNRSLPNFHQAFAWGRALSERVGLPIAWWQVPVGNMSLSNGPNRWHDNRVDYFLQNMNEVAEAHGAIVAFGAGAQGMTTPSTDNGNLANRVRSHRSSGGQRPCP